MAKKSRPRKLSVYLYIPNIIGYIRVLMNCFAFYICSSNKQLFSVLYFISFVCDALDGWFARKFNQVSTFGAVLDMVTDRISTACLLLLYITLFLLAKNQNENLTKVVVEAAKQNSALAVLLVLLLVGWAIKQAVNFIQMKTAADLCVDYDINKKQKA